MFSGVSERRVVFNFFIVSANIPGSVLVRSVYILSESLLVWARRVEERKRLLRSKRRISV